MSTDINKNKCPGMLELFDLALGQLDASKVRAVLEHLAGCPECRRAARAMRTVFVSRFGPPARPGGDEAESGEEDEERLFLELSGGRGSRR